MVRNRRKKAQENCIKIIVDILEDEIMPKYHKKIYLARMEIHKQPRNKYYTIFTKIIEYIDSMIGSHKNPFKAVVRDYLTSIFEHYKYFGRTPYLTQVSPSINNMVNFEEWIRRTENEYGENYWIKENSTLEIIEVPLEPIDFEVNIIEHGKNINGTVT